MALAANVQVRLLAVREGVECRAVLRPCTGPILVITATRSSTIEAAIASASGLARELQRRYLSHSRKSQHRRKGRRRRAKLAA